MRRLEVIKTVFLKEAREMLRDRRSLVVMFGLPLVLYPLAALGIASIGSNKKQELTERVARVAMPDGSAAPHLRVLIEPKSGVELVTDHSGEELPKMLAEGKLDAIIEVPPGLEDDALAGKSVEVHFKIDRSRSEADYVDRKLQKIADEYQKWVIEQRLAKHGVPEAVLTPVKHVTDDVASKAQRFGRVLGQALPVLLLMTGMLGALFPALNATTTERELGTLETLLVTPAGRTDLLVAKGALVLVCALLTAGLNMLSMSLVLLRSFTMIDGAPKFSISGSMLVLSYVAAVPALILFSAVVMIVGLSARNFREANAFATPVMLIPLAAMVIGIMEPPATPALLITPVANTTIIIRQVLTGRAESGPFLLAFASSCLYAGLILSAAGRVFSSEQLVNPAWEPLSLKGLRRGGKRVRRLPAIDEALVLFCGCLLLLFYISPSILAHVRSEGWKLLAAVVSTQLLLILLPTLLLAKSAGWNWTETFSLRRARGPLLLAATLIGAGLAPWAGFLYTAQEAWWPRDPDTAKQQTELFLSSLSAHPFLTVIVVGLLAGICEEMLFRGPVQASLLRRVPPWIAIIFAAVLFSAAHLDLHGLVMRAGLGVLLGWMVWRSGSIFPAMLAHAAFDSTQLAIAAWTMHHSGSSAAHGFHVGAADVIMLGIGAAVIVVAVMLWRRGAKSSAAQREPMAAPWRLGGLMASRIAPRAARH